MKWMSLEVWKCIKWLVAWTLYCIIGAVIFISLEVQEKDVERPHKYWQQFKELIPKEEEKEQLRYLKKNLIKMCDHTYLNQSFSFELSDVDGLPVWREWENMTENNEEEERRRQESLSADLKDVEMACRESLFVVQRITSYDTAPSMIDAMYYTMTAITTIGYGHICPSTTANKIFCVLYCLIGVPLTCIFLNNFSESLSIKMLHTYKRAVCYRCQYPGLDDDIASLPGSSSECTHEDDRKCHSDKKVSLLYLITAFFLGLGFIVFMFIPSIALMFIEDWTYLDSFYFTFITLSTIGFGDFVAGYGENHESGWGTVYKLFLILWIITSLGYWVLVLKFVTKALKKTTRKLTKSFSSRVVTDQKTFLRGLVKKVKHEDKDITESQHNMMELMNEVEGALSGKDGLPIRPRSVSQGAGGQRFGRTFRNGNVQKFLSESVMLNLFNTRGVFFGHPTIPAADQGFYDEDFEIWCKKIRIWQAFTNLEAEKQGPALLQALEEDAQGAILELDADKIKANDGVEQIITSLDSLIRKDKTQDAVLELDADKIKANDGVEQIITSLDSLFRKDNTQCAFEALEAFEGYKRPKNLPIADFCNEFECLYNKTKSYGTMLSDDVLAFKLLKAANLPNDQEQLAKATITELKLVNMKAQLKKIFGLGSEISSAGIKVEEDVPSLKSEDEMAVAYGNAYRGRVDSNFRGNFCGRSYSSHDSLLKDLATRRAVSWVNIVEEIQ